MTNAEHANVTIDTNHPTYGTNVCFMDSEDAGRCMCDRCVRWLNTTKAVNTLTVDDIELTMPTRKTRRAR